MDCFRFVLVSYDENDKKDEVFIYESLQEIKDDETRELAERMLRKGKNDMPVPGAEGGLGRFHLYYCHESPSYIVTWGMMSTTLYATNSEEAHEQARFQAEVWLKDNPLAPTRYGPTMQITEDLTYVQRGTEKIVCQHHHIDTESMPAPTSWKKSAMS